MILFIIALLIFCVHNGLGQPCQAPINLVNSTITGYCAVDAPSQLIFNDTQLISFTSLTKFTIGLWFKPNLKSPGQVEQALFRVTGDPSDVVDSTAEGIRLGLFYTADSTVQTNIRIQYSKISQKVSGNKQQFQYNEQKWIFATAGLDYSAGLISYYAWQPYQANLMLNPSPIQDVPNFNTKLPPSSQLQLLYWGSNYQSFCGQINSVYWYANFLETGYLHNWINLAFFYTGYSFNIQGYFKLEDQRGQAVRDFTQINQNGYLGTTSFVDNYDASWTSTELLLMGGRQAIVPGPQVNSNNLAYGVSFWFKAYATITGDGDSADLTPDLVLLKRYYLSTTEVLGIMIGQANGNQYSTKIKLHGVVQNLPNLLHTSNQWHFISVRVAYPNSVLQLSTIMFDVVLDQANFMPHQITTLTNSYLESITDTVVIGSRYNSYTGSLWMSHVQFITTYTLYTIENTNLGATVLCIPNCDLSINTQNNSECLKCTNSKYLNYATCKDECSAGPTALNTSTTQVCRNCDFTCSSCFYNGSCINCSNGFYLQNTGTTCVISDECADEMIGNPKTRQCTLCGNAILNKNEWCDDGNFIDNDGCSDCKIDQGYICKNSSVLSSQSICYLSCGDGLLEQNETCDLGKSNGPGCQNCQIVSGWGCYNTTPSVCYLLCGDGIMEDKEQCDDGNINSGDGCSGMCLIEAGYQCINNTGQIPQSSCQLLCGDGKINGFGEQCDLGSNNGLGKGCTSCVVDQGWQCSSGILCLKICGNGLRDSGEQCDIGSSGQGCTNCKIDPNYICTGGSSTTTDVCTQIANICGDGLQRTNEQCDDGNTINGDGCSSQCTVEIGWVCSGGTQTSRATCFSVCGDSQIVGSEQCDDGNIFGGDGCNQDCQNEQLYNCHQSINSPTICIYTCGDGIINNQYELCDDGNRINGDGCSNLCQVEQGWSCVNSTYGSLCISCGGGCGYCQVLNGLNMCINCLPGMYLDTSSGICNVGCNDGFSKNIQTLQCDACPQGCSQCVGNKCLYCNNNQFLLDGECYINCPEGYYNLIDSLNGNTCTQCNSPCIKCQSQNQCQKCDNLYYLDEQSFACTLCNMGDQCLSCDIKQNLCTKCQVGFYIINNGCSPIPTVCGDGLLDIKEQCDDGNGKNGDGCNSLCKLEKGWNCILQQLQGPSLCYELKPPQITQQINNIYYDRIFIQFSRNLNSDSFNNLNSSIMVSIPYLDAYKELLAPKPNASGILNIKRQDSIFIPYSYQIKQKSKNSIEIIFSYQITVKNLYAVIVFNKPQNIQDIFNWTLVGQQINGVVSNKTKINPFYQNNITLQFALPYYIYYTNAEILQYQIIQWGVYVIIILGLLSAIAFGAFIGEGKNWKFVEQLQIISCLQFIQWRQAYNLDFLLDIISQFNGRFICNIFSIFIQNDQVIQQNDPFKFVINNFSGQFMISGGGRFISSIIYLTLFLIIIDLLYRFIKITIINYYIELIRNYLLYQAYIRLIEVLFLDLVISILLQINNPQPINLIQIINLLLAITFCFIIFAIIILIFKKWIQNQQLTKVLSFYSKFGSFFDSISFNTSITKTYTLVPYFQKILIATILIFMSNPSYQVYAVIITRISFLYIIQKYDQPFIIENIYHKEIYQEIGLIFIYLTTLILMDPNDSKQNMINAAWITTSSILFYTLAQIYWLRYAYKIIDIITPAQVPSHHDLKDNQSEDDNLSVKIRKKKLQQKEKIEQVMKMEQDFFNGLG